MKLNLEGTFTATLRLPSDLSTMFTTSSKGSDGLILDLVTPEGEIQHVVWLTANSYERGVKSLFEAFGFDGDFGALANGTPFPRTVCSIVTEMEDFTKGNGEVVKTCKVKWLNPPTGAESTKDVRAVLDRLAKMGGKPIAQMHREAAQGTSMAEMGDMRTVPF